MVTDGACGDEKNPLIENSEFLILLNQSATDREELARLLHISETQLSYICGGGVRSHPLRGKYRPV